MYRVRKREKKAKKLFDINSGTKMELHLLIPILFFTTLYSPGTLATRPGEHSFIEVVEGFPSIDSSNFLSSLVDMKMNSELEFKDNYESPWFFKVSKIRSTPLPWQPDELQTIVFSGRSLLKQTLSHVTIQVYKMDEFIEEQTVDLAGRTLKGSFDFNFNVKINETAPRGEYKIIFLVVNRLTQTLASEEISFEL
mmetsp:Transcript_33337/g.37867  ORF Transcript_33337/g.37867 Transcript_33337/m.37867 type:complete len:195 (+) Transcript_33337:108-692(+)